MSNRTFQYAHLVHLSDRALEKHLRDKGRKTPLEIQAIREVVRNARNLKRSEQARRTRLDRMWRDLIAPLTNELRSVASMQTYSKQMYPSKLRKEALDAYEAVLRKLKEKLKRYHKAYDMTPKEKAAKLELFNAGEHWVDWVPPHIVSAIAEAFADIPTQYRARVKTPFSRELPKAMNSIRKAKLMEQIVRDRLKAEEELSTLQQLTRGESNEAIREVEEHLQKLHEAEGYVLVLPDTVLVPLTWQELIRLAWRDIYTPEPRP